MAEVMTAESIVEAEWLLKGGYWTKVRFPFRTGKGAWSDVDVLSYSPAAKHLVISESKVRGAKNAVMAYTRHSKDRWGTILDYDGGNYFSFLDQLPTCCSDGGIFDCFGDAVDRLTVQLVSNYVIEKGLVKEATRTVAESVEGRLGMPELHVDVMLDTTLDVLARVIELERTSGQGRRYGHPVLDIARELNRYLKPSVRHAGRDRTDVEAVRDRGLRSLRKALAGL